MNLLGKKYMKQSKLSVFLCFFLMLCFSSTVLPQYQLFIKYNSDNDIEEIRGKIERKQLLEIDRSNQIDYVDIKQLRVNDLNNNIDINKKNHLNFTNVSNGIRLIP